MFLLQINVQNRSVNMRSEHTSISHREYVWKKQRFGELIPGTDPNNPVIIEFDRLYQVQQEDREREQNLMRPWYERK